MFFKFSTDSMEWTDLSAAGVVKGDMPSARNGHTMTAVGRDIYLFGGNGVGSGSGKEGGHLQAEVKRSRRSHGHFTQLHLHPSIPHDIISVYSHGTGRARKPRAP